MRYPAWMVALLAGLAVSACSSLPDAPGTPEEIFTRRNQAANNMEYGNRYFKDALYEQALDFYEMALDNYMAVDDTEGMINARNSIGKVFFLAGDMESAMSNYTQAYSLSEKAGRPVLLLQSANNMGEIRIRGGEDAEALDIFRKTLDIGDIQSSGTVELAVLYHNMGAALRNRREFDAALASVQKAADLNTRAKRFEELAANHYLLASIYFRQNKLTEAGANAEQALDYDKKMENSMGIAQDLMALGAIAEKAGKPPVAFDIYKRAFLVYRSLRYISGMNRSLEKLIAGGEQLGLKEETERYREAYNQLQTPAP